MKRALVLHGPNLNLLGEREVEVYGTTTLAEIHERLRAFCQPRQIELRVYQSNHEGALIDCLHQHRRWADGIVFNPGAYTHTSYALRDAVAAIGVPTVEVHLSDIAKREDFRKVSVIAPACVAQVSGLGWKSYLVGLEKLLARGSA